MRAETALKLKDKKDKVSYEKIAVIGLGSLGGFFSDSLARTIDELKTLILIDYDIVIKENLSNSIYMEEDIGKKKIDALQRFIKFSRYDVNIICIDEEFLEKKTMIPDCNLVFDCRDYVYDRYGQIDARLYISNGHLIIDFNRFSKHDFNYEGSYGGVIERREIAIAGMIGARIISDKLFLQDRIKNQTIYKENIHSYLTKKHETIDVMFEENKCRITDLADNFPIILRANEKKPIRVSLKRPFRTVMIEKGKLTNYIETSNLLSKFLPNDFREYSVHITEDSDRFEMLLLPESGGA